MGLFDALLSQEGVNLTGGGFVGAPDDKLMETRFDDMGNAYQVDVRMPLHQGHTKANSFNIPDNAQGLLQPEMPTESIDLGRQQVVQPSPQMMQPVPQSSFMPGSQESMAQNQQSTISPWSPEQTDYTDARNVMSGYKGGERLAQRDSGTFQDLTPNADPSQAMEMLAMFKKEGKALTDLQFEKAMGSLGMSDVLAENRSQMNNVNESVNKLMNDNTNDFGEQVSADSFGQSDYDLNQQRQDTLDWLMMQDSVGERADNSMEQMYALNGTTPNVIPEPEPEPTFTPDSKATDFWNEGAERDFNIKQGIDTAKEFGSDAIDTAGGILGPIAKSWYGNLTKDSERDVAEYKTDESLQGLMGQNVKRNIADMVKGGVDAAMNPVETADAIASLVSGTVQHALPDDMAWNEESKDMASAVADIYAERYGSLEGFKKALAENPVEVIAELTGAGLITKVGAVKLTNKLKDPDFLQSMAVAPIGGLLGSKESVAEESLDGVLDGVKKPKVVRNVRSNNPGNIKDFGIKWNGMTGTESGGTVAEGEFVVFDKPENGIRALTRDLTNKRKRGLDTITKILNKYAPNGKENDTKSYIKDVARDVGIGATDKLSDKNMYKMIKAITKHEGGKESLKHFSDSIIKKGMKSAYKNKYQKFK
jgi:hypothetical protein